MKKRLSLLMALMMIVSLLPMSAFAAAVPGYSTQNVTASDSVGVPVNVGFVVPAGATIGTGELRFEIDNGAYFVADTAGTAITNGTSSGFVTKGATTTALAVGTDTKVSDQIIVAPITVGATSATSGDTVVQFNGYAVMPDAGDVTLTVVDPANTGIGGQSVKVAVVKDADTSTLAIAVKDADKTMSFDGGTLSQFEIKNLPTSTTEITLEVDDAIPFASATVIGLGGATVNAVTPANNKLTFTVGGTITSKSSIVVVPTFGGAGRKASEGNVTVDVTVTAGATGSSRAVIGKLVDYNVTMTVVEQGKKEIPSVWGGEDATVKVTLKGPKGSFSNRAIEFTVNGADVKYGQNDAVYPAGASNPKPSTIQIDGDPKLAASVTPVEQTVFKNKEFEILPNGTDLSTVDEVSFTIDITTAGDKDGVATITAAQRGWEVTADLAKITPKFAVTTEVSPVKKGEAKDTANVVITEAKAGLLAKGERLVLTFDTRRDYTQFTTKSVKVEATNGMTFDTSSTAIQWVSGNDGRKVGFSVPITKVSAGEPAVITVSGLNVAVDGSSTDDMVKVEGKLINKDAKTIDVSAVDYVKVVKEYALESITSVFTVGQTAYTVNNVEKVAASAPYIKNGRTMLPIRAVAESLGLTVQWNGATKTASFADDTKVAAVTIGASVLYVNGTPMPLSAPAELVNGTTFVELRSLATAFSVQIDWDAAAKTATVSK